VDTTTKKPKWHKEEIYDDGSSFSFLTGGFLPVLRPTSPVAAGGSAVAPPTGGTSPVVITDDDWEPTSPTGTSPVAAGGSAVASASMAAVVAGLQPPPPGMVRAVRARVAAFEAATGVVVSRTFPVVSRTTEVATQTDDMVLWSCHSCSKK
jgi:hypothetical protein